MFLIRYTFKYSFRYKNNGAFNGDVLFSHSSFEFMPGLIVFCGH